jgi:hypothetical protein
MKNQIGLAILWPELIRRRLMAAFASYRPELHYMRGPGPKLARPLTDQRG